MENNTLDMLMSREQLIEDIDAIITSQYLNDKINEDDMEDLILVLCDAVCKNFPTKWYSGQPLRSNCWTVHYRLISSPDPVL